MASRRLAALADQFSMISLFDVPHLPSAPPPPSPILQADFYLDGIRALSRGWAARARDNIEAISLSAAILAEGRPATPEEQARLMRFVGFGATDLAQGCFPTTGSFRQGWEDIARLLKAATRPEELKALARATQFAHYTPEPIARAMWAALLRLGFRGGLALEPGVGAALFPATMPAELRGQTRFIGVEIEPVSARIAALLRPSDEIRCEDFTKARLPRDFDLAIGNPPFSDLTVRTDQYRGLRLHDCFLVKAADHLQPGGLAAFATSRGTLDKADAGARVALHAACEFIGAIRLPDGAFRASAGTDVGVDLVFLRRRSAGAVLDLPAWLETASAGFPDFPGIRINRYFLDNPEMVLGRPDLARSPRGETVYACRAPEGFDLEAALSRAVARLPEGAVQPTTTPRAPVVGAAAPSVPSAIERLHEGSYLIGADDELQQIVDGRPVPVRIRAGGSGPGIFRTHAAMIRKLIPLRDAVREILRLQMARADSTAVQAQLGALYDAFTAKHGPINRTEVSESTDAQGGKSEIHRQVNLIPFRDDPDTHLLASIENYSLEADTATKGPIFSEVVVAREIVPAIETAADALARCLHETGRVDIDRIAALIGQPVADALADLGPAVYRDPDTAEWQTADAYLSGPVRAKLAAAQEAAKADHSYRRNVEALETVQPVDVPPSDITARLGAPWIPADVVQDFVKEVLGGDVVVRHTADVATWWIDLRWFRCRPEASHAYGTPRYSAGQALLDALNARTPRIVDRVRTGPNQWTEVVNAADTEAAKTKQDALKRAFEGWVWGGGPLAHFRSDRLARLYNDTYNDTVPRSFDGSHLILPGASASFRFRSHQLRAIWRILASGTSYIAHAVGAGKSAVLAAAVMEQRRLGLASKPMMVVPGHCLAQVAREFLSVYPLARILVADETAFAKDRRQRFLARAATADWDCILITHSAFKLIATPKAFEQEMIADAIDDFTAVLERVDESDRLTRKKLERAKQGFEAKLEALSVRHDTFLTLEEIGVDQILVDEAHEFRKLTFTSNMTVKGIDANGSQMAWDLWVKAAFVRDRRVSRGDRRVDRALVMASGTPITNTLGELYTVLRFMDMEALRERGLHEFDAWAASFGESRTELELQPSGTYKPITRFSEFVNVPELIALFRARADVVTEEELRDLVPRPRIRGGKRQIMTSPPSEAFREFQRELGARIKAIAARSGPAKKGDDILLTVIGDGRHGAIDLRMVDPLNDNEPTNKLNKLIANVLRIHHENAARVYTQEDGTPYDRTGCAQMIFSDLGTEKSVATRGFSAYVWIRQELIRLGVPADEIAFVQDYKNSRAKARLFAAMRAGIVKIVLGSTQKMGTGVNAQLRLKALHHLDVPWLPSSIMQREGRIDRQGNQNDEIELWAYATEGSTDATMWQTNERKARFIAAAMAGDRSVRRIDDVGEDAVNLFALAKALASGDPRLMQKAGLESEVARLQRLRSAHYDGQHAYRARIRAAERTIVEATESAQAYEAVAARVAGPFVLTVGKKDFTDPAEGGKALTDAMKAVDRMLEGGWFKGSKAKVEDELVATVHGLRILYTSGVDGGGSWSAAKLQVGNQWIGLRCKSITPGAVAFHQVAEEVAAIAGAAEAARFEAERARALIADTEPLLGRPFDLEGELNLKLEELDRLNAELDGASIEDLAAAA